MDPKNVATQMETYFAEKQAYPAHGYGTDPAAGTAGADFTNNGQTIAVTKNNKVQNWPVNASKVLAGTYCLTGGSWYQGSMSGWLTYDSDAGGPQPMGADCG